MFKWQRPSSDCNNYDRTKGGNQMTLLLYVVAHSTYVLFPIACQPPVIVSITTQPFRSNYGLGGRASRPLIGISVVKIPGSSSPHVDLTSGKILNPKLPPMAAPTVYEYVGECFPRMSRLVPM